jgi:CheY-like chemotaxis protein
VDDDPGVLKGLRGLLSDEGFSPVEARSAAEAVRLLDAPDQPPALMLLDLRMPGETGLELLARLPRPLPSRWWFSPEKPRPPRPCRR